MNRKIPSSLKCRFMLTFAVGAAVVACSGGSDEGAGGQAGSTSTNGTAGAPSGSSTSMTAGGAMGGSSGGSGGVDSSGTQTGGATGGGSEISGVLDASASGTGGQGGSGGAAPTGGTGGAPLSDDAGPKTEGGSAGAPIGASDGGPGQAPVPLDSSLLSKCAGTKPIKCTFDVPANGNYTVTVELGSANAASKSRVQGEEHRIAVPPVSLAAGSFEKHTFSLNVREEIHDGYGAPGKVLNLLIDDGTDNGSSGTPALHGVGFLSTPAIPTIFIAGDSTVCDWEPTYAATKEGPLERGWAQELSQFFLAGVAVANYADSGENSGGFYTKFWKYAKPLLREGDYVFVQFGHNDDGLTKATFQANMTKYVTDARAVKATPVLFTPVARKGGAAFNGRDQDTRDLAKQLSVALVDTTNLTLDYYAKVDKAVLFENGGSTHFSEYGATQVSKLVADYLKTSSVAVKAFLQ